MMVAECALSIDAAAVKASVSTTARSSIEILKLSASHRAYGSACSAVVEPSSGTSMQLYIWSSLIQGFEIKFRLVAITFGNKDARNFSRNFSVNNNFSPASRTRFHTDK